MSDSLSQIDLTQKQHSKRTLRSESNRIVTLEGNRLRRRFVSKRHDADFFCRYTFTEQRVPGPGGVDEDLIRECTFVSPAIPVFGWRGFPMVLLSFLMDLNDTLLFSGSRIDLTEHGSPASFTGKLENPFCGIAVSENRAWSIRGLFVKMVQRALLKPFVSLRDQLPAVNACRLGFQFESQSGDVWSFDVGACEARMKSACQTPGPDIGDEFTEQATELQRSRNSVMLTGSELAADPLSLQINGHWRSTQRQVRSHRSIAHRQSIPMIRAKMRRDHGQSLQDPSTAAMPE